MAEDSDLERTEPASQRRLDQAREEGHVPQSRELSTFLLLMVGGMVMWMTSDWLKSRMVRVMQDGLTFGHAQAFNQGAMQDALLRLSGNALVSMAPFLVAIVIAALASPVMMGGFVFSTQALGVNMSRLNPMSGIGRVFSWQGVAELVKGVLKSSLVGYVGFWVLWSRREEILGLMSTSLDSGLVLFSHMVLVCSLLVIASLALVAGIDVPFQLWQYHDRMKMTKEDLKQELKEQEGDPQIKARIRARQREMAKRRMMEAVPKADVVVTNPTHFAVAIKYEAGKMGAPTVVAKGADLVAQAIRALAVENHVPLLEAPPLARALFRHTEIGDQIPAALYTAVAEVMAYVYRLNQFLSLGGLPPDEPHDLPVPESLDPGPADLNPLT
jgi:flagellar biosynthesis protein FlhB